jgi:hypothetical protein
MFSRTRFVGLAMLMALLVVPAAASGSDDEETLLGDEVCVAAEVEGATGELCARRDGFQAVWTLELVDTSQDGDGVKATASLRVGQAPDETATITIDADGASALVNGRFSPRFGTGLERVALEVCVDVRFGRDDCQVALAPLPQLPTQATAEQRERLETLVFELPLEAFMAEWDRVGREGVDATFDWSSDGCSAGLLRDAIDERLEPPCIRHDFAYRNFGQAALVPTDEVRLRADDQLAQDISAVGQGRLASGFRETLQRFGGPVFFGDELAGLWGVPDFVSDRF